MNVRSIVKWLVGKAPNEADHVKNGMSGQPTPHLPARHAEETAERQLSQPPSPSSSDEDYIVALTQGGWSYGRAEDVNFLKAALRGQEWPKGISLRKHGQQLFRDDLKAGGYRANLVVTHEFLRILTPEGQANPIDAAQFIVSALSARQASHRNLIRIEQTMGSGAMVQVYANTMLAGPCPACLNLAERPIPANQAPRGPLPECPHPDQCVLFSRILLNFD